jgi:hypothetical protein
MSLELIRSFDSEVNRTACCNYSYRLKINLFGHLDLEIDKVGFTEVDN